MNLEELAKTIPSPEKVALKLDQNAKEAQEYLLSQVISHLEKGELLMGYAWHSYYATPEVFLPVASLLEQAGWKIISEFNGDSHRIFRLEVLK